MAARILLTTFDCRDAVAISDFWATALGYEVNDLGSNPPEQIELHDPVGHGHPLFFVNVPEPKTVKNRVHLDLVTDLPMADEVERLVAAGRRQSRCTSTRLNSTTRTNGQCCGTQKETSSVSAARCRSTSPMGRAMRDAGRASDPAAIRSVTPMSGCVFARSLQGRWRRCTGSASPARARGPEQPVLPMRGVLAEQFLETSRAPTRRRGTQNLVGERVSPPRNLRAGQLMVGRRPM